MGTEKEDTRSKADTANDKRPREPGTRAKTHRPSSGTWQAWPVVGSACGHPPFSTAGE
jgi:hypothetical protein